ncbi:MAG: citrate synthase/methylcitrate synthase [Phenylobacterium sp.]
MDGLEGVIAAETVLSDVDGAAGRLVIRGCELQEIAGRVSFEAVAARLLDGFFVELPGDLRPELGRARERVYAELGALDGLSPDLPPVDALRALIARLPDGEGTLDALVLIAAPAVLTPAILRRRSGLAPIPPDARLGHAADMLRMLRNAPTAPAETAALDAYLVTVIDHGLNASTFAARIVASTRAGLTSAVLAGLSALKGPLHGGAPGPVIDMLDDIGSPERARPWLEAALDRGERLMGFGHRIYKVRDPRADVLKRALGALASGSGRLALAEAVEREALDLLARRKPGRALDTNVEFYTAVLLETLGFPPDAFTCVFAAARVAGWIGHAREQALSGRLIRPQSRYVGPEPRRAA